MIIHAYRALIGWMINLAVRTHKPQDNRVHTKEHLPMVVTSRLLLCWAAGVYVVINLSAVRTGGGLFGADEKASGYWY